MDQVTVFKALANESRLNILRWLKDPEQYFAPYEGQECKQLRGRGVCVGAIHAKLGLCQSTASHYLALLEQAGLVTAHRCGQMTFYERNETALEALSDYLRQEL